MSINKWIWCCSVYIVWIVFCIAGNIIDIVINHHFLITSPLNVLALFIAVMLLDDMLDFKKTIEKRSV